MITYGTPVYNHNFVVVNVATAPTLYVNFVLHVLISRVVSRDTKFFLDFDQDPYSQHLSFLFLCSNFNLI